jgi:hypothetical protein
VSNNYVGMNVKVIKRVKKYGHILFQGATMKSVYIWPRRTEKMQQRLIYIFDKDNYNLNMCDGISLNIYFQNIKVK